MSRPFADLLRHCISRGLSPAALGRAIGVSPTRMSRALGGHVSGFRAESVLRLARVCDLDPLEALRIAGHGELAELLEQSFDVPGIPAGQARETVRRYLGLAPPWRRVIDRGVADLAVLEAAAPPAAAEAPATGRPPKDNGRRSVRRIVRPK